MSTHEKEKTLLPTLKNKMAAYYLKNKKMFSAPSWIKPPFLFFRLAIMFLCYSIRTTTYQKMKPFSGCSIIKS
jgi:hypothetical protein